MSTPPRRPRARTGLLVVEVAAIVAAVLVPLPVPAVAPLLVVATMSVWARGGSWADTVGSAPTTWWGGAVVGAVALVLALLLMGPVVAEAAGGVIQWSAFPVARGHLGGALTVAVLVLAGAAAAELVLRGWIAERVAGLVGGPPARAAVAAVVVAAAVEVLLTPGGMAARVGAGLSGLAFGALWAGAGGRVAPALAARLVFALGVVGLDALRLVS
ncbi:MAG: hypothetical protein KBG28_26820 [Kofleriaceae bacterium]|nr:hypothetical protein [Kofleriaceae bacterium]